MDHPKHIVAVSALISHPDGRILLVRSPRRGWEFPGGQVELGETLTEALTREVREEAGVEIEVGRLVGVYSNVSSPEKVMFGFEAAYRAGDLATSMESLEVAWFSRADAIKAVTYPSYVDRLADLLEAAERPKFRAYRSSPYSIVEERVV